MTGFVDATDPAAVTAVLQDAVRVLGVQRMLETLAPVVPVRIGRKPGVFRAAEPDVLAYGDEVLSVDTRGRGVLQHVVGGIVLSNDQLAPAALPGTVAALVVRCVADTGNADDASVVLTSLRDALAAGR